MGQGRKGVMIRLGIDRRIAKGLARHREGAQKGLETIYDILFHQAILFVWGIWLFSAVIYGWLIAGSIEDPDESAAAAGLLAVLSGIVSSSTGEGFVRGFTGALSNLLLGLALVPLWPAFYLLPVGWCLGESFGLEWWQTLLSSAGFSLVMAIAMGLTWLIGLATLRRAVPHFLAAMGVVPLFGIAPLISFTANAGLGCGLAP